MRSNYCDTEKAKRDKTKHNNPHSSNIINKKKYIKKKISIYIYRWAEDNTTRSQHQARN